MKLETVPVVVTFDTVKVVAESGNYTVTDSTGASFVVLAGTEHTFGIGLPILDTETPETPGTEDTGTDEPEGRGCDVTGEKPNDLRGRFGAMLLAAAGLLRRKRK